MHVLIVGVTGTGKTRLVRQAIQTYQRHSIVYDPLRQPGWPTKFVYSDGEEFVRAVQNARSCMVIVDESPELIGGRSPDHAWLATQARHLGHQCHFVAQRAVLLSPTVRGQASHVIMFRSPLPDAKLLSDERVAPGLMQAPTLALGEYLYARPDGTVTRHRLDPIQWSTEARRVSAAR